MEFERQIYHGNIWIKFDFWYDCAIFDKVMPLRLKKFHLYAVSVNFFAEVVHIEMKFVIQIYQIKEISKVLKNENRNNTEAIYTNSLRCYCTWY